MNAFAPLPVPAAQAWSLVAGVVAVVAVAATLVIVVRTVARHRRLRRVAARTVIRRGLLDAVTGNDATFPSAKRAARQHPDVAITVVSNVTRETPGVAWGPVADLIVHARLESYVGRLTTSLDPLTRADALRNVALLRLSGLEDAAVVAMRDQSAIVRVAAARAWTGLRGVDAVPAVVRMLANEQGSARERLAELVVSLGTPATGPVAQALDAALDRADVDPVLVDILGRISTGTEIDVFAKAARSARVDVRASAATHASAVTGGSALIGQLCQDPAADVRAAAVASEQCPHDSIIARLGDPSWLVRHTAGRRLAATAQGRDVLRRAALDQDTIVADAAHDALAVFGGERR